MDDLSARQFANPWIADRSEQAASRGLVDRRQFSRITAGALLAAALGGCGKREAGEGRVDKMWGEVGVGNGRFSKPRAIAIDKHDELYIVDMTARIQVFDADGRFLRGWQTPAHETGKPTGLSIAPDGNLLVADTHYHRVLTYTPAGELLSDQTLGGTLGQGPGEFGFVTDAVRDAAGNYYVSEYGEWDRIQKFSPERAFIVQWGGHGSEPGQFLRPQHLELDQHGRLWVADACNHRIQVFDERGRLLTTWGTVGGEPGQLYYPYCLVLDGAGHVYVCEFGNHRVQKFTVDGQSVACWGGEGRSPGKLYNPWALALDSRGRVHVLDSNNHRVQRIIL
ncbi:MAG: NHL repeat-containing protein [Pirellulales bacterium]